MNAAFHVFEYCTYARTVNAGAVLPGQECGSAKSAVLYGQSEWCDEFRSKSMNRFGVVGVGLVRLFFFHVPECKCSGVRML